MKARMILLFGCFVSEMFCLLLTWNHSPFPPVEAPSSLKETGLVPGQFTGRPGSGAYVAAQRQAAGEERGQMLARVAFILSQTSSTQAAQMVEDEMSVGSRQNEAAMTVIHQWALRDMPGARAFVELFPDGHLRNRALDELQEIEQFQNAISQQHPYADTNPAVPYSWSTIAITAMPSNGLINVQASATNGNSFYRLQ